MHNGRDLSTCRAVREDAPGSSVSVALQSGNLKEVFVFITGPSFGEFGGLARALARVDDGVTVSAFAQTVGEPDNTLLTFDYTQSVLDSLKKGANLTVALNGYKFTLKLTDTGKMIAALADCITTGQARVEDWVFDNAQEIKGPTND